MSDPTLTSTDRAHHALARIAALLGCSVDVFHGFGTAADEGRDTCELVRLWTAIGSDEGRRAVLECAQAIVRTQRS